jgi:ACT domain-containing protein
MKAIVSVFAKDARGITAYVTSLLAERDINILDISQTLMQEYFAMIMLAEIDGLTVPFSQFVDELKALGKEKGLEINTMHEDIFNTMHHI